MKSKRSAVAQVITAAIDGSGSSDSGKLAREIAAYLLETGQTGQLNSLMRDVMQQRADAGTLEVVARSASPLDQQVQAEITDTIKRLFPGSRRIVISPIIDSAVIAGVKLELANQQLDLTVRAKLNRFKQLAGAV